MSASLNVHQVIIWLNTIIVVNIKIIHCPNKHWSCIPNNPTSTYILYRSEWQNGLQGWSEGKKQGRVGPAKAKDAWIDAKLFIWKLIKN